MQVKSINYEGLKENVIVGRLIPAGTGFFTRQLENTALVLDKEVIAERKKAEAMQQELDAKISEIIPRSGEGAGNESVDGTV